MMLCCYFDGFSVQHLHMIRGFGVASPICIILCMGAVVRHVCHCLKYVESTDTPFLTLDYLGRVATNLENLKYSGISLNMENSGNSVQPQGKIVTNKVFLVCHSNVCVKQLFDWVNRIIRISGSSDLPNKCQQCSGDLLYCWY